MGTQATISSNSFPSTVDGVRLTKMRSALPPLGFGFCASCTLVPPLAALAPTDQTTTIAFDASVTALPQSFALHPFPLWQMYKNEVFPRLAMGTLRTPFVRVKAFGVPPT